MGCCNQKLEHFCKISIKSVHAKARESFRKILGRKYASFYDVKMYTTHATYHPTKMREQIHATMKVNSSKTGHYIKLKLKLQIDKVLIEMYEKSHSDIFNHWRLPLGIAATIRKSQAKCSVATHGCLREKFISDKLQPVSGLYINIRFLEFLKNLSVYKLSNFISKLCQPN